MRYENNINYSKAPLFVSNIWGKGILKNNVNVKFKKKLKEEEKEPEPKEEDKKEDTLNSRFNDILNNSSTH
jgi:hypothetical protein